MLFLAADWNSVFHMSKHAYLLTYSMSIRLNDLSGCLLRLMEKNKKCIFWGLFLETPNFLVRLGGASFDSILKGFAGGKPILIPKMNEIGVN